VHANNADYTSLIRKSQPISTPKVMIPTTAADHVQHVTPDVQSHQQNDT
jgi:hypothetical protein